MGKYMEWNRMFRYFKREYPEYNVRGLTFEPYGYQEIRVFIPGKGKLIYNTVGTRTTKIRWEERWVDEKEVKLHEKEERPDMYQRFLSEIAILQKETHMTQGDIADATGISRQSINKYLSGLNIPKVSTMRKICDSLGIRI